MRTMKTRFIMVFLSILAITLAAVAVRTGHAALASHASGQAETPAARSSTVHGFDTSNLDRSCQPCKDFNEFANGGWMKKNPIPPAYAEWGRFNELAEQNREVLRRILEQAENNPKVVKASNEQKIGDYYASCMDEEKIESEGIRPLTPELERVGRIGDLHYLEVEVARLHGYRIPALFGLFAGQDFKNSKEVIAQAVQGGLTLPDRDYYTKDDPKSKEIREAYLKHVGKMFELAGDDPASAADEAKTVMKIETSLAEASLTRVERRNPEANYHKMTVAELKELAPHFDWTDYFKRIGLQGISSLNVGQPDFFRAMDRELTAVPLSDWKTYLRWHLLNAAAPSLSSKFVEEDFDFNGRILTGAKEILPRWKRCVAGTDRALGEALGQFYVEQNFTPQAKARAQEMVQNLVAALRDDLATLSWMGDATRQRAIAKLDAFAKKIGYPDKWRNYEALQINRGPYLENVIRANEFESKRNLGKIGKPLDRTEWGMTPPTVNAYYNPSMNEIVFPAGILQPPFYDPQADDAINYGGVGAVIGHEMTHGFDDQGAKFDAEGNLEDWWTPSDLKNFKARTECVVNQFNGYVVEDSLHENGNLVVGESVADLGGLTISFAAFEKSLQGKPRPKSIDGFTPEQRFFLGWAQVWAENVRPEYERLMVNTNPHPLGRFRVDGPLSNMPAFAQAFGCKAGDPMVRPPEERCQIW